MNIIMAVGVSTLGANSFTSIGHCCNCIAVYNYNYVLLKGVRWTWRSRLWSFFPITHGLIVLWQPILWLFCLVAVSLTDTLSYDYWSYGFTAFSPKGISSHDNRCYHCTAISTRHPRSYSLIVLCPMPPRSYGCIVVCPMPMALWLFGCIYSPMPTGSTVNVVFCRHGVPHEPRSLKPP